MNKVVIGLSGGMDSATLLGYFLNQGYEVHTCSFQYGSKQNKYEEKAVSQIIEYYYKHGFLVVSHRINLENAFGDFRSNLLKTGGDIPEGHYEDESMKATVVPGRNLIFLSIMAGLAESIGAKIVAIGVHSGDHAIYPDCRPEFVAAAHNAIELSTGGKVKVVAPFLLDDKAGILHRGLNDFTLKVPYELTRTCYKDQEYACGKCGSCQERIEAFHNLGIEDPIIYEAE